MPTNLSVLRSSNASSLAAILVLTAFSAGFSGILGELFLRWNKSTEAYSHGWLLFAFCGYLLASRFIKSKPTLNPSPAWLLLTLIFTLAYIASAWIMIEIFQYLLLLPVLVCAFLSVFGWRQTFGYLAPFIVLGTAIPVWDYLSWPLQLLTVKVNDFLLGLLQIDFYVEDVYVHLVGKGIFEIANGCSGLRYLIVATSLSLIYSYLNFRRAKNWVILISSAVAVGLVTNWIRVFIIIYAGYSTDMKSSLVHDHDFFGWVLFGVALLPLFWLAAKLANREVSDDQTPFSQDKNSTPNNPSALSFVALPLTFFILLMPATVSLFHAQSSVQSKVHITLNGGENWLPVFSRLGSNWEPLNQGYDSIVERRWYVLEGKKESPDKLVSAYVVTYLNQKPGKELIQDANQLYSQSQWTQQRAFQLSQGGKSYSGVQLRNRNSNKIIYVAYGYYVSGHWTSDRIQAKLLQLNGLFSGRQDASLIAVSIECGQCESPQETLKESIETVTGEAIQQLDLAIRESAINTLSPSPYSEQATR